MNTTIYLIRHSEPLKVHIGIKLTNESLLEENKKTSLSITGEKLAEKLAKSTEFENLSSVWSSNYVRAIATAKYFVSNNNLKINIDERLDERIHGVNAYSELPPDFEKVQLTDASYKIGNGENQIEVQNRMYNSFLDILKQNKGRRVVIISHATAITFLLKKWCEIQYPNKYLFQNKSFFDGNWHYLETFKLTFDKDNTLIDIKLLEPEEMG